jgi:uncharacterized caspase-like protein
MKIIKIISILILILFCFSGFVLAQNERDIIKAEEDEDIEEFKSDRLAIVVGINNYLNSKIPDLRYSEPDAKLIKSILADKGVFNVMYYSSEQDSRPATKENILKGLKDANQLAKNGLIKTFVFYFAGHGYRHDNENYLAPMEINLNDIAYTGIALSEVLQIIDDIQKNAKTMVFLDACRNEIEGSRRGGSEAWTEEETSGSGLGIVFSTSEGEYSYELEEEGHGIFTLFLAKGLLGEADMTQYGGNENGFVSFYEIASYVSKKLLEWSISNSDQISQTPRVTALEINGDFILTKADDDITIEDIDIDITNNDINTNINNNSNTNTNNNTNDDNNNDNNNDDSDLPDRKWSFRLNFSGGLGISPSIKAGYDINKYFSIGLFFEVVFADDEFIYVDPGFYIGLDILSFFPINHYKHDLKLILGVGIDTYSLFPTLKSSIKYYYNLDNGIILGAGGNFVYLIDTIGYLILLGVEGTFGFRF